MPAPRHTREAALPGGPGEALAKVLGSGHEIDGEMSAGDLVRWTRQVVDLLGQIADSGGATTELRSTARQAIAAVNRGVLAYHTSA
ncbi:hypothetical protein AB0B48_15110 [Micromonospora sp. NPDC049089]|uniref:hypothetical protein n=1 Tax=unclassified Micromonospora TaxID=2617518 RepID=UPI0033D3EB71